MEKVFCIKNYFKLLHYSFLMVLNAQSINLPCDYLISATFDSVNRSFSKARNPVCPLICVHYVDITSTRSALRSLFCQQFPNAILHGAVTRQTFLVIFSSIYPWVSQKTTLKARKNRRFAALLSRIHSSHTQNALSRWRFARSETFLSLVVHHKLFSKFHMLRSVYVRDKLLPRPH